MIFYSLKYAGFSAQIKRRAEGMDKRRRTGYLFAAFLLSALLCACAGTKVDMVQTPAGMNMQRGRNYREVIEDFEDKGFSKIRTETIEDLDTSWTVKNEEVEEIYVGGDNDYDAGVWVPANTEVVIRYHTYNRKKKAEEQEEVQVEGQTEAREEGQAEAREEGQEEGQTEAQEEVQEEGQAEGHEKEQEKTSP